MPQTVLEEDHCQVFDGFLLKDKLISHSPPQLCKQLEAHFEFGKVYQALCITPWYSKFNGSHFGLPPSFIHRMTAWTGWQSRVNYDIHVCAPIFFILQEKNEQTYGCGSCTCTDAHVHCSSSYM